MMRISRLSESNEQCLLINWYASPRKFTIGCVANRKATKEAKNHTKESLHTQSHQQPALIVHGRTSALFQIAMDEFCNLEMRNLTISRYSTERANRCYSEDDRHIFHVEQHRKLLNISFAAIIPNVDAYTGQLGYMMMKLEKAAINRNTNAHETTHHT